MSKAKLDAAQGSTKRRFAHIPGVSYPESAAMLIRASEAVKPGAPAIFDGEEWLYVAGKMRGGNRRVWAIFPVRQWAERWRSELSHPENFEVKQILNP